MVQTRVQGDWIGCGMFGDGTGTRASVSLMM
jgi:hypothetical protein